ncbi:MAG: ATP-binding cassette domain-containing protein [Marinilabiliales bacterium]
MVKGTNLFIGYNNNVIVKDFSFSAKKGEKICFYGPSGYGKTTALIAIPGLSDIISGTLEVNGILFNNQSINLIRKNIAWLPQNIYLPVSNGKELLEFYLNIKETEKTVKYLEAFGLSKEILDKDIQEISGGQKQRLLLSACLSLEREILLLDEPTSALDEESVKKIIEVIFNLSNITVISTSHNQTWINNCDKTYEIK